MVDLGPCDEVARMVGEGDSPSLSLLSFQGLGTGPLGFNLWTPPRFPLRPDMTLVAFADGVDLHSAHPLLVNVPGSTGEPDRPVPTRVAIDSPRSPVLLPGTPWASSSLLALHAYLL